ncbi:MAG: LamG domain-containing protein, partial [Planctomycetota bacterium]|nr:LamG domain-containing protein [Planctomycetota bacterium]
MTRLAIPCCIIAAVLFSFSLAASAQEGAGGGGPEPAPATRPLAHWSFDDPPGSAVNDDSGNGFNGEVRGASERVAGISGSAISLPGPTFIEFSCSDKLQIGKELTIQAWVKPENPKSDLYQYVIEFWDNYLLRFDTATEGGRPSFFVYVDGNPEPRLSGKVPEPGAWHHVVAVWTGDRMQLWIDGENKEAPRTGKPSPKKNTLKIGSGFVGALDEIKIFDRALSEREILEMVPPILDVSQLRLARAVSAKGDTCEVSCEIRNKGGRAAKDVALSLTVPKEVELVEGDKETTVGPIEGGKSVVAAWKIRTDKPLVAKAAVAVRHAKDEPVLRSAAFVCAKGFPDNAEHFTKPALTRVGDDLILGNSHLRLVFPKNKFGYGVFAVDADKGGTWERLAVANSFGMLAVKKDLEILRRPIHATEAKRTNPGQGRVGVQFKAALDDGAGVKWNFSFVFIIGEDDVVQVEYQATPNGDGVLIALQGPMLRVGEGSFGSKKGDALFCGLEWLVGDERSSSDLDMHDVDCYTRYMPHPNKVTIPLMAVSHGGCAIALFWDALQQWDGY